LRPPARAAGDGASGGLQPTPMRGQGLGIVS